MSVEKMHAFIIRFVFICLIVGLLYFVLKYLMPMLMPFFVAFLFAFLLQPLITWIQSKTKVPRNVIAVLTLVAFYALLGTLVVLTGTQAVVSVRDGFAALPRFYAETLEPALVAVQESLEIFVRNINPDLPETLSNFGESITQSLSTLVSGISSTAIGNVTGFATQVPFIFAKCVIAIIASFFLVTDYYKITGFIARQLPKKGRDLLFAVKSQGVDVVVQFGRAYAILLTITFVELTIGFLLLRIDNAFLAAFFVALVDILPILGAGTVLIPWGLAMLILGNFPMGIGLLLLYGVISIVRQTLEPRVVGKHIGLYPLVTLICMFVGGYLFGFIGLFGLPIFVTVLVQLNREGHLNWLKSK